MERFKFEIHVHCAEKHAVRTSLRWLAQKKASAKRSAKEVRNTFLNTLSSEIALFSPFTKPYCWCRSSMPVLQVVKSGSERSQCW